MAAPCGRWTAISAPPLAPRSQPFQRLPDGRPWPLPLALHVDHDLAARLTPGGQLALRDAEGVLLGVLTVTEIWPDGDHHGTALAGPVAGVEAPTHYAHPQLHLTPAQLAARRLPGPLLGMPLTAPLSRADLDRALAEANRLRARLLLADCGPVPAADDQRFYARLRWQQRLAAQLDNADLIRLSPGDPHTDPVLRVLAVLMLQNYGCDYCLVPDGWRTALASAGLTAAALYYRPESAAAPPPTTPQHDDWQLLYPPRHRQGFTLFFTGLSGSGKSTLASAVLSRLLSQGARRAVTLLDGDRVRRHLSSELSFSKPHRDLNVLRIGFVAAEITKHGGAAVCAPIAPYAATRAKVRAMVEAHGGFIEVHVATPLAVCEQRDRKGLYAKARAGLIEEFTGISDPYQTPEQPELMIDTSRCTVEQGAGRVLAKLAELGYLGD